MENSPNVGDVVAEPLAPAPTTPVPDERTPIAEEDSSEEMTPPKQQTSTRVIAEAKIDTLAKGVSAKVTAAIQTRAALVEEEETLKNIAKSCAKNASGWPGSSAITRKRDDAW